MTPGSYAGSARAHWSKLTDNDWQTITGKKEHRVGVIQERYGIVQEEAERQVDAWSRCVGYCRITESSLKRRNRKVAPDAVHSLHLNGSPRAMLSLDTGRQPLCKSAG